jgi:mannan endo-1,4-beta-mannosidase
MKWIKIITFFVIVPVSVLALTSGCSRMNNHPAALNDTTVSKPPTVTTIVLASTDTIGNGVNLQPSYYNSGKVYFGWTLMKQYPGIKSVRIEIEPTIPVTLALSWIMQAQKNGYRVIATYHKYTVLGSDDAGEVAAAANWWKMNYPLLSSSGPVIINLINEWGSHNLSSASFAKAYNPAIATIRQVYEGPIILDCPGYGQETAVAAGSVTNAGSPLITDSNIIFSVHVYPNGYNSTHNHNLQISDLDELAHTGRPCIIGEFGNDPAGNVDWMGLVNHAKTKHWAVLGWSWNGDGGSMNMTSPAWKTDTSDSTFSRSDYFNVVYDLL